MQVNLLIAVWNANGILNHINEIELFLKNNLIDILLVSESHLTSKSYIKLNGYDIITTNHPENRAHGGAAVIIRSNIKYDIADPVSENFIQAAGVVLTCNNSKTSIYSAYFPPRFNVKSDTFHQFFSKFGNKFIVGGDFNAKHPWWGSRLINPKGSELYKCISTNHYSVLSTGSPTYWPSDPNKRPDLLDFIIFSGIPQACLDIATSDDLSSDHSPVIVNFCTSYCKRQAKPQLFSAKTDVNFFKHWIEKGLNLNISLKTPDELDRAIETFTNLIHESAHLATPHKDEKSCSDVRISYKIKKLIAQKRRLRKIWQTTRHPDDRTNYNRAKNSLTNTLKEYKNDSINAFLSNLSPSNNKEHSIWKATKFLKRPQKRNIPFKNTCGVWCRNDKNKSEAFKEFLEETFSPFSFCEAEDERKIKDFLDVPCQMYRPIKHCSPREVEREIIKLNPKKSPGYDFIDAKILKSLPRKGLIFLSLLFNAALRLTYFPFQWKFAKIFMVLKPNKPEDVISSYRPISLLPVICKVFEKLIQKRLSPVLEKLNIIPEHQFGFRHGHGTVEQCHRVVHTIRQCLENKQYCSSVFLDVKQAFDKVWHDGLLFKMKTLLPTPFYLLLKSYLSERRFFVNVNDADSEIGLIKSGVPQGSVLGPILYTLFTSDFPSDENIIVATYADDTSLLSVDESPILASNAMQKQLDSTQSWLKKWNIKVNTEKSVHVTFTLRKDTCPPVSLGGEEIPTSNCVKYLGLHIDKRLTWKTHIKLKRQQLDIKTKRMYWLLGSKSQLSLENKVLLYKSILKPVWTYGIELWGTASNSNIEILQRYQSKTLRLISNSPWFVSNKNIHKDLCIPEVKNVIRNYSSKYLNRLSNHSNVLAINLLDDSNESKRLKRSHVLDLPYIT